MGRYRRGIDEPCPTLLRVIPVNRRVHVEDAVCAVVSSVEIWSTMLVLHAVVLDPDGAQRRSAQGIPKAPGTGFGLEVRDDVGTEYRSLGLGRGGSFEAIFSHQVFDPPPPEATVLWLRAMGDESEIAVPLTA